MAFNYQVWVVVSIIGLAPLLDAHPVVDHPEVLVSVFNDAGVDGTTILHFEETASRIYKQAGVSIFWNNCSLQPGPEFERCLPPLDDRHLVLHIEHQARTLATDIYGVAFLGQDGLGAYCDVFYDRIVTLHQASMASKATILGIVAAHELGHLLLGSQAHSSIGIMRQQLQEKDFSVPELGATTFSRQQTRKMLDRLARIQAKPA